MIKVSTVEKQKKGYQTVFIFLEIVQRIKSLADNVRPGIYTSWFLTIIDEVIAFSIYSK